MQAVKFIEGLAYPLGLSNVDTDMIVPAPYLKTITRSGLGAAAFQALRAQADNVFDDPRYQGASSIIAGDNFGCGSSREHAAWALVDMGVQAVIAPSFSDIFSGNAFKNGIVTIVLPQAAVDRLLEAARSAATLRIDLEAQTVRAREDSFHFELDPFRKHCLLNGLDEVGLTLARSGLIDAYEARLAVERPWV